MLLQGVVELSGVERVKSDGQGVAMYEPRQGDSHSSLFHAESCRVCHLLYGGVRSIDVGFVGTYLACAL